MTHESWIAQLDAYLDGELEGGKMQELDRHLRECPSCAAESLRRLQWKRTAHSAGQRYKPDSALRERMQKSLSRGGSKSMAWRWQAFGALAAALLVMAGLGIVWREDRQVRENQIVSELADLHVTALASATPVLASLISTRIPSFKRTSPSASARMRVDSVPNPFNVTPFSSRSVVSTR